MFEGVGCKSLGRPRVLRQGWSGENLHVAPTVGIRKPVVGWLGESSSYCRCSSLTSTPLPPTCSSSVPKLPHVHTFWFQRRLTHLVPKGGFHWCNQGIPSPLWVIESDKGWVTPWIWETGDWGLSWKIVSFFSCKKEAEPLLPLAICLHAIDAWNGPSNCRMRSRVRWNGLDYKGRPAAALLVLDSFIWDGFLVVEASWVGFQLLTAFGVLLRRVGEDEFLAFWKGLGGNLKALKYRRSNPAEKYSRTKLHSAADLHVSSVLSSLTFLKLPSLPREHCFPSTLYLLVVCVF